MASPTCQTLTFWLCIRYLSDVSRNEQTNSTIVTGVLPVAPVTRMAALPLSPEEGHIVKKRYPIFNAMSNEVETISSACPNFQSLLND